MTKISKNLGLVSAIHVATTAPSNIYQLWYNLSDGLHYSFDILLEQWIALNSLSGGETFAETLAIGNTTGGNDIKISSASGDSIVYINAAGTKSLSLVATPVLGNFTQTFQDKSGTIALLSDIAANNELSEILANGNTTANDQVIKALNGGGQLNLRVGVNNKVFLSNDNGAITKEMLWIEDDFIAMYARGGSLSGVEVSEDSVTPLNSYINIYSPGDVKLRSRGKQYANIVTPAIIQTYTFPEATGTIALTSDISATLYNGNGTVGAGRVVTLTDSIAFNGANTTFSTQNGYWQGAAKILYINPNATTGNLFVGEDSGNATMTGINNIGIGYKALRLNTTGTLNTAIGHSALTANTTGVENTAIGMSALAANTTGVENVAVGLGSLRFNTTGFYNIGVGLYSLFSNTVGSGNIGIGQNSLYTATANNNIAIGFNALRFNTIGTPNIAIGTSCLTNNIDGQYLLGVGASSLSSNTTGSFNTALGADTLLANTTGGNNLAIGYQALLNNTTASSNVAIGVKAMNANMTGNDNTSIGRQSGFFLQSGSSNVFIGYNSMLRNVIGDGNVAIGHSAGAYETGSNKLFIDNAQRANEADGRAKALIYGIFDAATANQYLNINANTNTPLAHYNYMAASNSADTIGDVRTYATYAATVSTFFIEKCTVANAAKGGGTWVLINSFGL